MDVRAYAEKDSVIFLSLCSVPYSQMRSVADEAEKNRDSVSFFRFFERGSKVRLVMGCRDLQLALKILSDAVKAGGKARLVTDTTLCSVSAMGCRKSGVAGQIVSLCDDNQIEVHHIGITDTEIMLCISSKDREKFRRAFLDNVNFTM